MNHLTFDEATHTYRVDGRVVSSVTQILASVYKDVYAGIPAAILERKSRLGTAVHRAIELWLKGLLDVDTLHQEVLPYFECWFDWWAVYEPRGHGWVPEQRFYSVAGDYCGTIDLEVPGVTSVDWKITSNQMPTHGLQVTGYAHAKATPCAGCLYLKDDGSPAEFVEYPVAKLLPDWLATRRVHQLMGRFQ